MTSIELRNLFLEYFKSKGHAIVKSSSLIPDNDPTLLFTTAGMVQFKPYYSREKTPPFPCAATVQKCFRAGGKASDLENVGKTPRHHTFFEMLGNFSFGDYFKKEAIEYAYEFVTKVVKIPQEKLWISVYKDDEEAAKLWMDIGGFDKDRIVYCGKKDNWWGPAGDEGACGPCSEIYIDLRDKIEYPPTTFDKPPENDGFLEFWNLVFNQYYQDTSGNLTPLQYTGIDTGMGLERLLMILQDVKSVYETDLFEKIINKICKLSNLKYSGKTKIPINVIADHIRALTFVISEGVFPSNEGRGYVVRHILRRAIRYGKFIGFDTPFLYEIVDSVVDTMGNVYPEITERVEMVKSVIYSEEEAFFKTLNRGFDKLQEIIKEVKKSENPKLKGEDVFLLYDSLGFPVDFTIQVANDEKIDVDLDRFNELMKEQKEKARASWKGKHFDTSLINNLNKKTEYIENKYEEICRIELMIKNNTLVESISENDEAIIILNKTPCYAEKGGQIGDKGIIELNENKFIIEDVKLFEDLYLHFGRVLNGVFKANTDVKVIVDSERKKAIARNHTATHIIHKALREVVGSHAMQAGSLVSNDRLRFDFTHTKPLSQEEIEKIEDIANRIVLNNSPVIIKYLSKEEAIKDGAVAIFEEKYGDIVRVVEIPGFSKELCGGTHVKNTGDIGLIKIISESSVSAGTRRIEALTGYNLLYDYRKSFNILKSISSLLNVSEDKIIEKIKNQNEILKQKDKEIQKLKNEKLGDELDDLFEKSVLIGNTEVLIENVADINPETSLTIVDKFKEKVKSGIIVLLFVNDEKVGITVGITKDLTSKIKAGDIAKEVAKIVDGGGGGRPDLAQAGGKNPKKINEALQFAKKLVESKLIN